MKGMGCEESHLDSLIAILWFRLSGAVVFLGSSSLSRAACRRHRFSASALVSRASHTSPRQAWGAGSDVPALNCWRYCDSAALLSASFTQSCPAQGKGKDSSLLPKTRISLHGPVHRMQKRHDYHSRSLINSPRRTVTALPESITRSAETRTWTSPPRADAW